MLFIIKVVAKAVTKCLYCTVPDQVKYSTVTVILLPAHPASFAHKFLFQRVPGCNSMADLSLK